MFHALPVIFVTYVLAIAGQTARPNLLNFFRLRLIPSTDKQTVGVTMTMKII